MEARIGTVVRSVAGRDKGRFLMVVSLDGDFAYVADGKERKLSKPKKKRLKHISATKTIIEADALTDKVLRAALREYAESRGQSV